MPNVTEYLKLNFCSSFDNKNNRDICKDTRILSFSELKDVFIFIKCTFYCFPQRKIFFCFITAGIMDVVFRGTGKGRCPVHTAAGLLFTDLSQG